MARIILASQSPRRREMMKLFNIDFEVIVSYVEEIFDLSLDIEEALLNVALVKCEAVFKDNEDAVVIGVDSIVYQDNKIINKPKDKEDAFKMIKSYSNSSHEVISGVCIKNKDKTIKFTSYCTVNFYEISDKEINEYLEFDEYKDKAGAYAIQGYMSKFISSVEGDFYSVVGFPISKIQRVLRDEFAVFE